MSYKTSVALLSAMTLVVTKVAGTVSAQGIAPQGPPRTELLDLIERCEVYREESLENLQLRLEELLLLEREDECIPLIVALLGGPPLASGGSGGDDNDDSDIPFAFSDDDPPDVGVTVTTIAY